jgi:hypothetical protein
MNSRGPFLSILLVIILIVRMGMCISRMSKPSNRQTLMPVDIGMYDPQNSSYEARYAQWEAQYGKEYIASLSEGARAVYLKDVNQLTKVTDEVLPFPSPPSWDSLKSKKVVISYPKDWVSVFDEGDLPNFSFQPKSLKSTAKEVNAFRAVLVDLNPIKQLLEESKIGKDKLFPAIVNAWWERKISNGFDIRGLEKIKFLGYETYKASGQLVEGEERFTAIIYLINAPQGVYEYTILGNPESMIKYAKTANNIIQTLKLL